MLVSSIGKLDAVKVKFANSTANVFSGDKSMQQPVQNNVQEPAKAQSKTATKLDLLA